MSPPQPVGPGRRVVRFSLSFSSLLMCSTLIVNENITTTTIPVFSPLAPFCAKVAARGAVQHRRSSRPLLHSRMVGAGEFLMALQHTLTVIPFPESGSGSEVCVSVTTTARGHEIASAFAGIVTTVYRTILAPLLPFTSHVGARLLFGSLDPRLSIRVIWLPWRRACVLVLLVDPRRQPRRPGHCFW